MMKMTYTTGRERREVLSRHEHKRRNRSCNHQQEFELHDGRSLKLMRFECLLEERKRPSARVDSFEVDVGPVPSESRTTAHCLPVIDER